jgi:SET domain-containing protein
VSPADGPKAAARRPSVRNTESTEGLPFEIRRSAIQGRGAFATRRLRAGQKIVEYTGERISQAEGDRRYAEGAMARHHTFLFTLDDDLLIDGGRGGNASRFLNHSCDPNCEAVIHGDGPGATIFFHALRNIQPGTELTFDYKYERTEAHTDEDEQFYACRCGSPKCRGTILAPKKPARRGRAKS